MNLKDVLQNYYDYSSQLSSVNRQLCFGGIAVVWIFATTSNDGSVALPDGLQWPLFFLVAALAFDLLHYATATLFWGVFHRSHDKQGISEDAQIEAPDFINVPAIVFITLKVCLSMIGLGMILLFIWANIKPA